MPAAPDALHLYIDLPGRRVSPGLYSVRGLLLADEPTPLETSPAELRILSQ